MIYFDHELQGRVHQLCYQSLCQWGVLGLGLRESIRFTELSERYGVLNSDYRLYRKVR
jgi:chemotaxis protein methyltransferase CheR